MSRVDENMLLVTQLAATIEECHYDYQQALAISVSGLLADISTSLAVIADAIHVDYGEVSQDDYTD